MSMTQSGDPNREMFGPPTQPTVTTALDDSWTDDVVVEAFGDDVQTAAEDDYLDDELPDRPLRRRVGRSTFVLLALALVAGAFFAGVRVERSQVKSSSSGGTSLAALAARFGARGGGTGTGTGTGAAAAGGLAGGGAGVSGSITLIDGNNIYITLSDGSIVKAVVNAGSTISVTSVGTIQSMHPGDNVTVSGPTNANGDVTATSIRDTGAGAGGGGGGAGRRAAGGAGAAGAGGATSGAAAGGAGGAAAGGGNVVVVPGG